MTLVVDLPPFVFSKKFYLSLLWWLIFGLLLGCRDTSVGSFEGPTMGTTYSVKWQGDVSESDLRPGFERILQSINDQMSTYLPDSEISRFNEQNSEDWFPISREFLAVVTAANQIFQETTGAFDISVGPAVNLWGFGPTGRVTKAPSDQALRALSVFHQRVPTRESPPALKKVSSGQRIDLSGIAKGFAVDELGRFLEASGVTNYLVEIGGEVRSKGKNDQGLDWRLGVERPDAAGRVVQRIIPLRGMSLATSGDYRNYFEENGKRFSHIIDPRTRKPVNHMVASVSVLHPECMMADGYATAFMVLNLEEGLRVANELKLPVLWLVREGESFREVLSASFEK